MHVRGGPCTGPASLVPAHLLNIQAVILIHQDGLVILFSSPAVPDRGLEHRFSIARSVVRPLRPRRCPGNLELHTEQIFGARRTPVPGRRGAGEVREGADGRGGEAWSFFSVLKASRLGSANGTGDGRAEHGASSAIALRLSLPDEAGRRQSAEGGPGSATDASMGAASGNSMAWQRPDAPAVEQKEHLLTSRSVVESPERPTAVVGPSLSGTP